MPKFDNDKKYFRKILNTPYLLVMLMSIIIIVLVTSSIWTLYSIGLQQQKKRLADIAKSRASTIEVIAEYERKAALYNNLENLNAVLESRVLEKVIASHERFIGLGDTGEFTLAKRHNAHISFLLRHRHSSNNTVKTVPFESTLAEPMRHALKGESGTVVGLDYRGTTVLAAYEPIAGLGWGIVAKIDLAEIQTPYKTATFYGIIAALLLTTAGGSLFLRISRPLIEETKNRRHYNRMLFNESPIGLALCDLDGKLVDINPAFAALTGRNIEENMQMSYWEMTPEKYMHQEVEQLKTLLTYGKYGPYEKEYIHKDGSLVQVRLSGRLIEQSNKRFIWSSVENITQQKHDERELRQASLVFEHTHEGIMITNTDTTIIRVNRTFTEITGYTTEEAIGKKPTLLQSGKHDKAFYKAMWEKIETEGTWYGEICNRRKNGEHFAVLQSITAIKSENGELVGYVSVFADISELKAYEVKLTHLAMHDSLTALPNRMHFHNNLEQAIATAKRHRYKLAVLFLDLDRFKEINDTFGHEAGDRLLQAVAKRLQASVREEDTVARLGGDEFAVILSELCDTDNTVLIAKKIIQNVTAPLTLQAHTFKPALSIGISIFPDHGDSVDTLLKTADQAMYNAKNSHDISYALYKTPKNGSNDFATKPL